MFLIFKLFLGNFFAKRLWYKRTGSNELLLLKNEVKLLRHNKTSVAMKDLTIMILFSQTVTLVLFDLE